MKNCAALGRSVHFDCVGCVHSRRTRPHRQVVQHGGDKRLPGSCPRACRSWSHERPGGQTNRGCAPKARRSVQALTWGSPWPHHLDGSVESAARAGASAHQSRRHTRRRFRRALSRCGVRSGCPVRSVRERAVARPVPTPNCIWPRFGFRRVFLHLALVSPSRASSRSDPPPCGTRGRASWSPGQRAECHPSVRSMPLTRAAESVNPRCARSASRFRRRHCMPEQDFQRGVRAHPEEGAR